MSKTTSINYGRLTFSIISDEGACCTRKINGNLVREASKGYVGELRDIGFRFPLVAEVGKICFTGMARFYNTAVVPSFIFVKFVSRKKLRLLLQYIAVTLISMTNIELKVCSLGA